MAGSGYGAAPPQTVAEATPNVTPGSGNSQPEGMESAPLRTPPPVLVAPATPPPATPPPATPPPAAPSPATPPPAAPSPAAPPPATPPPAAPPPATPPPAPPVETAERTVASPLPAAEAPPPSESASQAVRTTAPAARRGNPVAETISGRVHSISGRFDILVDDARGFVNPDHVRLQPGTTFVPPRLSLGPGTSVVIKGYNAGRVFAATEVDLADASASVPPTASMSEINSDQSVSGTGRDSIVGRIRDISGPYDLQVAVAGGLLAHVHLHPGTTIVPTGLQLVPGMSLTIKGYVSGTQFEADEIDTIYARR